MSRGILLLRVKGLGCGNAIIQAFVGKRVFSFDYDMTTVKKDAVDSHMLSVAELVRDTIQSTLPANKVIVLEPEQVTFPIGLMLADMYAYIVHINDC